MSGDVTTVLDSVEYTVIPLCSPRKSFFGHWKRDRLVPWSKFFAVVDDWLQSILSIVTTVNRDLGKFGGHSTPSDSNLTTHTIA